MRLFYLLGILLLSAAPAQAQTCTSAPSCAALGYDKSSSDCSGQAMLKCPFDQSKVFCAGTSACGGNGTPDSSGCKAGDILFEDKSCSSVFITTKTAIGVVLCPVNRLAIALEEKSLKWGGYEKEIGSAARGTSGKSNTSAILAYGKANNVEYPAAEYCNTYSTAGTKAGDWFLPSIEELKLLSNNFSAVNASLKVLGKAMSESESGYYWSSSEGSTNTARRLVPSSGDASNYNKNNSNRVRPVLAF